MEKYIVIVMSWRHHCDITAQAQQLKKSLFSFTHTVSSDEAITAKHASQDQIEAFASTVRTFFLVNIHTCDNKSNYATHTQTGNRIRVWFSKVLTTSELLRDHVLAADNFYVFKLNWSDFDN